MQAFVRVVVMSAVIASAGQAQAQFIKGNEAVRIGADGKRTVETPPMPSGIRLPAPCPARNAACVGSAWLMVETSEGLAECTEFYARPTTCRTSTFGKQKLARLWIVKEGGQWLQCQHPDLSSKCVSTKSLPIATVQ